MLVFSSELMMQSRPPSGLPSQEPAYGSKTRPAFSENFGSRGKIQYRYRQGLIASVSRIRQTVLGLIDRPKAIEVLWAKSEVDRRLSGNLVWQTASQAIALTIARSRRGKSGLASAARSIRQGEVAASPTATAASDGEGLGTPGTEPTTASRPRSSPSHPCRLMRGGCHLG